ncbi:hypothetical protein [Listeria newyorkensis]|uniref:hypothetical protein n=1 Tax=Listeria newyorkensis TaxID=1497681 RepID=UPI00051DEB50|nr:hypothetical protein [Listeria newyorkensis]KGL43566.1 hypothetical protein EP58_07445 [Listeria newyorkensis]
MTKTFILVMNQKGGTGKTIVSKALVENLKRDRQTATYQNEGKLEEAMLNHAEYIVYDMPSGVMDENLISSPMLSKIIIPVNLNKFSLVTLSRFIDNVKTIKEENPQWHKEIIVVLTEENETPLTASIFETMQEAWAGLGVHVINLALAVSDENRRNMSPELMEQTLLDRIGEDRKQELGELLELVK